MHAGAVEVPRDVRVSALRREDLRLVEERETQILEVQGERGGMSERIGEGVHE